jgi:hypothetical protein
MSKKLTAVIAAAALGAGVLLGTVGGVLAGDGSIPGMMGSGGDLQCDGSPMESHMTTEQMSQMMGGSFGGMMGGGLMGSGIHSQHHGGQP